MPRYEARRRGTVAAPGPGNIFGIGIMHDGPAYGIKRGKRLVPSPIRGPA
jgi:hypothetical protein